jgi:MFS family permease
MTKNKQVALDDLALGSRKAWLLCFIASLFFFFEFFQLSSFDPLNALIQRKYQLNPAQVSWLGSAFLWGNIMFLIPAGMLMDKRGARPSILASLGISIIGLALFEYGHQFSLVLLGRFAVGIGNAFCFIALIVLVSQWFPANKQAFAMAIMVNVGFLGGLVAHTPLVWVLEHYGWSTLMAINLMMGMVIWTLNYALVYDGPLFQPADHSNSSLSFAEYRSKILTLQNIGAGVYISFLNLPIMVLCALWGVQYLQDVHHLGAFQSSNVVSMIFLGSMIGSPVLGWLSDYWQRRKNMMLIGGLGSLALCLPLCFLDLSLSYLQLLIIFILLGFFSSAQVLGYPLITESNLSEFAGRATSLASMMIMSGGMLGQVIFGGLLKAHGEIISSASYGYAMILFPASIMIALFLLFWMKETFCRKILET